VAFRFSGIKNVVIPETLNTIGGSCFSGCTGLTNIYIPDSVTSFGELIFANSGPFTSVRLPSNLTTLPAGIFARSNFADNCIFTIPASVTLIDSQAFITSNIKSIDIPYGVVRLGSACFSQCYSLSNFVIPASVTYIDNDVFSTCTSLTNIVVPNSITYIGNGAFNSCSSLTTIFIPDLVRSIEPYCFFNSGIRKIRLPSGLTSIGNAGFYGCSSMTSIIIPSGVTIIADYAFYGSGVTKAIFLGTTLPTINGPNFTVTNDTAYVKSDASGISSIVPSYFSKAAVYTDSSGILLYPPEDVSGSATIDTTTISWTAVIPLSEDTITKYQVSYYDISDSLIITNVDVSGNVTQTEIIELTNQKTYVFTVKAFVDTFSSEPSSPIQVKIPPGITIDAPQNVTGTAGINSATISWSAVTISSPYTITKYQISYYTISNPYSITRIDVSANITQTTITGLTNFQTYQFTVKAFVNKSSSQASSIVEVPLFYIAAPQDVSGVAGISRSIINWTAVTVPSPYTITNYHVNYYDISNSSSITIADVSGNVTQTIITGLTNFKTYGFSVKAFVNDISSNASSTIQLTPFTIDPPQILAGTPGVNSATISWTAVTVLYPNIITKYQVSYYNITTPSSINTVDTNTTSLIIGGLEVKNSFNFSVKAFVNTDSSESSNIVTVVLTITNILTQGLDTLVGNEPPPAAFFYDLVTTSGFTPQELSNAGINVVEVTNNEELQQTITDLLILNLDIVYINL
jgi:hypothetical protein